MNARPMSIRFQEPTRGMSMGMGHDCEFMLVPEVADFAEP
jgi:hypothetical protein